MPALDDVTFHAKLGSQGERVRRLVRAGRARSPPLVGADPAQAERAAVLAKADLVTGMVGEFPELQGVMGRYYALHDGEDARGRRRHPRPLRAARARPTRCPTAPVSIAVALADKLDTLAGFFAIGEKPTGSGDPYALRRAALGVIRIIRENGLRLPSGAADRGGRRRLAVASRAATGATELLDFFADRLRVQLRAEGVRHDVLAAVFALGARRRSGPPAGAHRGGGRVPRHRGRRQPADRLSPRRQHPAHRGDARTGRTTAPVDPALLDAARGDRRWPPRSTAIEPA